MSYSDLVISNMATLLQNWRRKIAVGDFFGASFLEARAAPEILLYTSMHIIAFIGSNHWLQFLCLNT